MLQNWKSRKSSINRWHQWRRMGPSVVILERGVWPQSMGHATAITARSIKTMATTKLILRWKMNPFMLVKMRDFAAPRV